MRICVSFSKLLRQPSGDAKGSSPSITNTSAKALQKTCALNGGCRNQRLAGAVLVPEPRKARKNSDDAGSTTSTSLFLLKLCL